ncbi:translation factor Sua5 [Citromicrobium sp. RCC1885]|uniref:L-threonylcarbamoyladenylate synthase n=1 Tax=unclassified Citromicrobium TaxID=2630544 RepID=UPI0006C9079B|nr:MULTISPECIES: L-threonylcarbamoyladenylate synthase [unclassified Citromicrobium]MAO03856.1 L-threonylcarbamoyladenylate synthase [Citromicrobium sp.]KPM21301.1 translation factor Sua5 [Citromicrobium sp. RCC1885]KPM29381.1 translation factor Sua5 [Citromicrobium sp. RCC1878]MAY76171.1 L-threonylcarbamoyladenylate synthase [Citromicrobium sp.]OAM06648.1 translation factor Sua5 [Citromicrobium sp. RCC1897]|tara:strand:- start:1410 stop:2381 length:972 start_codon:yes stop_codon:yes gene_type:complete
MDRKYVTERLAPDSTGIARTAQILRDGGLVAVPTETVYGLAARADSEDAVSRIFAAKGRPSFNPLIVHVSDVQQAEALVTMEPRALALADRFWPGPLTLVLPRHGNAAVASSIHAGLPTLAVRCPAHPVMRAVLDELAIPVAAPSANASETVSPTTAEHVLATLDGRIDAVLDAGASERGLESTIVALRADGGWSVLREGPIGREVLEDMPGSEASDGRGIEAPGQMRRHYAPGKPLRLNARKAEAGEFLIGFGAVEGDVTLSATGDVNEAATRLYACLHLGAASDKPRIAVAPVTENGVGRAINDRLRRAAAPPEGDQRSGS